MSGWVSPAVAELIGAYGLIFMGAGSIIVTGGKELIVIAFAHGLAIGFVVLAPGKVFVGGFNPAVTLGFLATRKISLQIGAAYIIAKSEGQGGPNSFL